MLVIAALIAAYLLFLKPQDLVKQDPLIPGPIQIDFTAKHDTKAEQYYTARAEQLLNDQNAQLGPLFTLLRATPQSDTGKWCSFKTDPNAHETFHGCEIGKFGYIPLSTAAEKQQFYTAAQKLDSLLKQTGWKSYDDYMVGVKQDTDTDPDLVPFAAYVTTHTVSVQKDGKAYWPTTSYYKTGHYTQIDHDATCAIHIIVKDGALTSGLQLWLDCAFSFEPPR